MAEKFEFSEEELTDIGLFAKRFKELVKIINKNFPGDKKMELSNLMRSIRNQEKGMASSEGQNRPKTVREIKTLSPLPYMIINGVELFIELNDKFKLQDINLRIDELYQYYVDTTDLEITPKLFSNLDYLIGYYEDKEEFEKCVTLQKLSKSIEELKK
jgi:hypothetical protein